MCVGHPVGSKHAADVLEDSLGLFGNAAGDQFSRNRIKRNLAGTVQSVADGDRLRIWTHRSGSLRRGNDFSHRAHDLNMPVRRVKATKQAQRTEFAGDARAKPLTWLGRVVHSMAQTDRPCGLRAIALTALTAPLFP